MFTYRSGQEPALYTFSLWQITNAWMQKKKKYIEVKNWLTIIIIMHHSKKRFSLKCSRELPENMKHQNRHLTSQKVGYFNLHFYLKMKRKKTLFSWIGLLKNQKSINKLVIFNVVAVKSLDSYILFWLRIFFKRFVSFHFSVMHIW